MNITAGSANLTITLMTVSPFTLTAGTSYWFVLDGPATANSLAWNGDNTNTAPTASGGVTNLGYRFSSTGGTTWAASGTFNVMQIDASPVPEPATWALLGTGLLLAGMHFRRRR